MKTDIDISRLARLIDFPNYRVDTDTGKIYRYAPRGFSKIPVLSELKGGMRGRRNESMQRYFQIKKPDGSLFMASHGRLMIAATQGVSYYKIPQDLSCNYTDEGITVRSRSEAASSFWREKLSKANEQRLDNIDTAIHELHLLRDAYTGNRQPLFAYVYKMAQTVKKKICSKTRWAFKRAEEAFNMAIDVLYEVVLGKRMSNILRIEPWLIKTAIGAMRGEMASRCKRCGFSDKILGWR